MANPLEWLGEQIRYLFYGPVAQSNHHDDLSEAQPPALPHTSAAFDAHIAEAANYAAKTSSNMKTFSQAWDETEARGIEPRLRGRLGMSDRDRKETLMQCYLDNPWIAACVDVIAKRITSGGYTIEPVDQAKENEASRDTLKQFVLEINEHWDFLQLVRSIIMDLLIYGEAYAEIVPKDGKPWRVYKVDCMTMSYELDPHGQIIKYIQQLDSNQKPMEIKPLDCIIRWWLPHPRANMLALSPIERILDAVKLDKQMVMWNQTFFKKGAKAPYWIKGPPDENDGKRFATWFVEEYTGEKNAFKPMVTWGEDVEIREFKAGAIQLDFETGRDRTRDEVLAGFSTPPMVVGLVKTVGLGGTGESQAKDFQFNACDPVRQLVFEKINYRIVQGKAPYGFGITDYLINSRYGDYRSDDEIAKLQDMHIRNGSNTVDEVRQELGKQPYPKGGDVGIFSTGREIVPVPRFADLEDEQRQGAQLDLQSKQQGLAMQKQQQQIAGQQAGQAAPGGNVQKQLQSPKSPQNAAERFVQEDSQTGMMLAFFLKPDVADQLAIPGGESASDLHITLAYLGDTQDQPQDTLLRPHTSPFKIRSVIASIAAESRPMQGRVGGIGRFTSQDDGAQHPVYASVDVPGLAEFRAKIVQAIQAAGYYVSDEHGFAPHITLDYIDASASMPMKTVPALPLILDRVSLCVGDQCSAWRLGDEQYPDYWDDQAEEEYDPDATEPRLPAVRVGMEHYPGGKDHDQSRHGAWSPLSKFHNPKVHTKGAAKYNHLTIPAKQKLLATLAAGSAAKAAAAHAASSAGGASGSSSRSKTSGPKKAHFSTKAVTTEEMASQSTKMRSLLDMSNSKESAQASKQRIAQELATRLEGNTAFDKLVADWQKVSGQGPQYGSKIDRTEVSAQLVKEWQKTSGDSSPLAVHLQMLAEQEFGLTGAAHPFSEETIKAGSEKFGAHDEALRGFLRAQYDNTQDYFKKAGVDEVIAYRTMRWNEKPEGVAFDGKAVSREITLQPISAFSTSLHLINQSSTNFIGGAKYYAQIGVRIPVSRIIGSSMTGVGCKAEGELAVLGGRESVWQYADTHLSSDDALRAHFVKAGHAKGEQDLAA